LSQRLYTGGRSVEWSTPSAGNKENIMRTGIIGGMATLLLVGVIVRADEEKVPLDKVPKAVLDAVKKKFPGADLKGAEKDKEDKETHYEIALEFKGHKIEATFKEDGTLLSIEKQIAAKDLPKAVSDALEKKYPKATYKTIEEVTDIKGKEEKLGYEVLLVTEDKKTIEVELSPKGEILKEEKKDKKDD
jgi:hypothetical protein